MKKRSSIFSLILVSAGLFGMAFKCGGSGGSSSDGFSSGQTLSGRYINTNQGIQSFTFSTDGTFQRGGASSGSIPGGNGDYVSGSTTSGSYYLDGHALTLEYDNGTTEEREIEIFNCCSEPDYSQQTPAQLKINHVSYTNVSER